jgi:hypothetical protein
MKTIALILSLLFCFTVGAADVTFNLVDFIGTVQTLQRKTVWIDPLATVRGSGNNVVMSERRQFSTGTNGIFTATNMVEGAYRVTVFGVNTSVFRVNIPDTNGTLIASDYLETGNVGALETEEGQTLDLE